MSGNRTLKAEFAKMQTPSIKSVKSAGFDSINITWKGVPGVTGYVLYRSASRGGKYAETARVNGLSFTDSGLQTGKNYYYKIKAYYAADKVITYSGFSSVKYVKPVPAAPKISAAIDSNGVKISWGAVPGAAKYVVYRASTKKGRYQLLQTTTELQAFDTAFMPGKKYYYKVKACTAAGKTNVLSADSNIIAIH